MLLTILIVQVAVAIYAFVVLRNSDDIGASIRKAYVDEIFVRYGKDKESTEFVNDVQVLVSSSLEERKNLIIALPRCVVLHIHTHTHIHIQC